MFYNREKCIAVVYTEQQELALTILMSSFNHSVTPKWNDVPLFGHAVIFKNAPEKFKELLIDSGFKIRNTVWSPDKWDDFVC